MAYRIEVLRAQVSLGERPLNIQPRALEIAIALAAYRGRLSTAGLCALMYPDLDEEAANDRLRVNVFRLREQAPGLVGRARSGGYEFRGDPRIDLHEIEASIQSQEVLSAHGRRRLLQYARGLADRDARSMTSRWPWFEAIEGRIEALRSDACSRCLTTDFPEEFAPEALAAARSILEVDPCDENAYAVALRALLVMNRRIDALRLYLQYERCLKREFGAEPSGHLRHMVEAAG